MKINYNILWVENELDWLESIEDEIKDFIEEQGFCFVCDIANGKSEIIGYNKYDIILMDLNLASEPTGDEIIQEIRNNNIYTDVVLYSASDISLTRSKGKERELDGVYYSGRNADLFLNKVKQVIATTIRKTQDLANIRGLVMAEVSELDVMMADILAIFMRSDKNLQKFHDKVTSDRERTIHNWLEHPECKKDCKLLIRKASPEYIISNLDASQKARGVNLLLKMLNSQGISLYCPLNGKGFMENYENDIIHMRNNLAHCMSVETEVDGKEILKTHKGDIIFSAENFIGIRKSIVEYRNLFAKILTYLCSKD
ncbi:MAG: response regulator [Ruminococcus sp.]|nr:response regulator [Ruminococcus sp.]